MAKKFKNLVEMQEKNCLLYQNLEMYGTKGHEGYRYITFKRFAELVNHLRGGLHHLGIGQGDKVCIISKNSVEWAVAAYACYGLKAQYVPMYESQSEADWKYILNDCQAKAVFVANQEIFQKVKTYSTELPQLKNLILIEAEAMSSSTSPSTNFKETTYQDLLKIGQQHPTPSLQPEMHETLGLIYTSGTTGFPKGVILTHGNILSNLHAIPTIIDVGPKDRSLCFLPWAHIFGQVAEVHALIYCGFSAGLAENVNTIVDNLQEVRPTFLFSVPRVFNKIYDGIHAKMSDRGGAIKKLFDHGLELADKKRDQHSLTLLETLQLKLIDKVIFKKVRDRFGGRLRFAVSGASALNVKVAEFIDNLGIILVEGYGLSETSPLVSANTIWKRRLGSVGQVIPEVKVKIDKTVLGDDVQDTEEGEIVVYGPNVMQGYYNLPEETKKVMTADGGFRTGDLGRVDHDGFLYITGRIKEQYKLENGKYVVPTVIEDQIKLSPFVNQAFLYGANKPFNVIIIGVDLAKVEKWAKDHNISARGEELMELGALKEMILKDMEKYCLNCKSYEKPQRVHLTTDDWNIENGMITPSMKIKRKAVFEKYKNIIENLYQAE